MSGLANSMGSAEHLKGRLPAILLWVLLALTAGPLLWYGTRALVTDRFVIKGESMEPELHCIRLPGLRVRPGGFRGRNRAGIVELFTVWERNRGLAGSGCK